MKLVRTALALAGAASILCAIAPPASASTDKVVGNTAAAAYVFHQHDGDCEEGATDVVLGAITGARVKETTIDLYARQAGILAKDGTHYGSGSNWFGSNGIVKLLGHYGLKATVGSHTTATIESDLAAGDHVIAFVNAETVWAAAGDNAIFGPPPAGSAWTNVFTPGSTPDHALVLDQIDETTGIATLSDTGAGHTYQVPLSAFVAAVATSGYSYAVVTTH